MKCPYGEPGDRLWVKENFRLWDYSVTQIGVEYAAGGSDKIISLSIGEKKPAGLHRRSKDGRKILRPSIFMPRWASRITLEVVSVRAERVQEISQIDAVWEGIKARECFSNGDGTGTVMDPIWAYQRLWDSINAKRGFGWDKNPWVWVVTFKMEVKA